MEMQADEDAKNPRPFVGPACRVIGRDGKAKPPGSPPIGAEHQSEVDAARPSAEREEAIRREARERPTR
jgi:hypothetical protein